jgi:integrase/recombinase XerD
MGNNTLKLSQACEGKLRYKAATGKSPHTIVDYRSSFKKLQLYFTSDPLFASISCAQLIAFFAWLQDEYVSEPDGAAPRGKAKLSAKTVFNIHTNLSSLWSWAVNEELVPKNIIRTIDPPPVSDPVIEPFTKDEIAALLKACDVTHAWKNRAATTNKRSTAFRDRAIILALLDTGCRASELCGIHVGDLNLNNNSIKIRGKGPGRDGKERIVYFGKRTGQSIWKYLLPRLNSSKEDDRLFVVGPDGDLRPMTRDVLRKLLHRIGERAGLANVHPHRFRHTFAINYLRNEGDILTLQALLGHSDLEMVKRCARIAQTDCANAHRRASPVDNWKL